MPSDFELYKYRNTTLADIQSDASAATIIANEFKLSVNSVRGRLSRANTNENHAILMQELAATPPDVAPSVQRQLEVLQNSKEVYERAMTSGEKSLMFVSDIHLPYTRWDAYTLMMNICEDLKPTFVTGANDCLDNKGFGRWDDDRPVRSQVLSSDVANLRKLESMHYNRMKSMGVIILQVMGNHDRWWYTYQRENNPQQAESTIADYMEKLYSHGVLQFSRGWQENYIELGKGLVIWHGQFTNKRGNTLGKNNIEHFQHVFKDGILRSVIAGHTHRPQVVEGIGVGYPSVRYVNSGALTDYTPYLKRNPHGHGLGIAFARFDPSEQAHEVDLIRFRERGNKMIARFEGVTYETEINRERPDEYL